MAASLCFELLLTFRPAYHWCSELYKNNIEGTIPAELGNLKGLISLDLYSNNISGNIPHSLGKLKSLVFLWVGLAMLAFDLYHPVSNAGKHVDETNPFESITYQLFPFVTVDVWMTTSWLDQSRGSLSVFQVSKLCKYWACNIFSEDLLILQYHLIRVHEHLQILFFSPGMSPTTISVEPFLLQDHLSTFHRTSNLLYRSCSLFSYLIWFGLPAWSLPKIFVSFLLLLYASENSFFLFFSPTYFKSRIWCHWFPIFSYPLSCPLLDYCP